MPSHEMFIKCYYCNVVVVRCARAFNAGKLNAGNGKKISANMIKEKSFVFLHCPCDHRKCDLTHILY